MEFQYFYRLFKYLKINKKEIKKYRTLISQSAVFLLIFLTTHHKW